MEKFSKKYHEMGIEMLIEFSVTNFRSFCNSQTLSLVKSKGNELPDNAFEVEGIKDLDLLHSAAIYGANASGKSNLLKSIRAMKQIVTATSQRGSKLPITPFKLNKDSISKPTEFEVVFIVDNVRYQYGFSATEEKIFEEWLFAYPKGRAQKWFERIWSSEKNQYQWQFGNFLTGTKQVWQNATRENALFLSTAVQLNSEQLKPLFDWFKETLRFSSVGGFGPEYSASLCMENRKEEILKFMHAADLNISDINIETEDFSPSVLPNDMPESLREIIIDGMKDKKMMNIQTIHLDSQGNSIRFDLEEESDGTQKFFAFAGPWLDVLTNGYVLFVDELHDNLHPKLVQFLVGLFHSKKTNPKNAQLIFTTHETSILNQDVFRRDQVWFCERNQEQETVVYPLSDFSPKKGKENLEAAYLSGRYGALPFLRSLDTL
ncbi:AAA family ATPase [Neisseria wadsworthii]|nr:ATP-binding protein [Neisseria wadsworthii]